MMDDGDDINGIRIYMSMMKLYELVYMMWWWLVTDPYLISCPKYPPDSPTGVADEPYNGTAVSFTSFYTLYSIQLLRTM